MYYSLWYVVKATNCKNDFVELRVKLLFLKAFAKANLPECKHFLKPRTFRIWGINAFLEPFANKQTLLPRTTFLAKCVSFSEILEKVQLSNKNLESRDVCYGLSDWAGWPSASSSSPSSDCQDWWALNETYVIERVGTNIQSTDGVLGKNVFWRLFMPNKNIQEAFLMSATKPTAGRRQHLGKFGFLKSYKTIEKLQNFSFQNFKFQNDFSAESKIKKL